MSSAPAPEAPTPPCDAECGALLRRKLAALGLDAHVTHVPPILPPVYEDLDMTCPHGVRWHTAPTSEQIAKFVRDGVA